MRRILLTSSQVSVLVTSLVVISCTLALFLSGYAIQQRTLRDLRSAIKPRTPRPKPLPKFYLPEQFRKTRTLEDGTIIDIEDGEEMDPNLEEEKTAVEEQPVIEVKETEPEIGLAPEPAAQGEVVEEEKVSVSSAQIAIMEALQSQSAEKAWAVEHPDPLVKSQVPVSRAERRKLIKDEIHRLSTPDEKVYYQRRLW